MQTVREVMTTDVQACTSQDNVYEVALKMKELNVGAIPIVDHNQLVGMLTDRDLVTRGIAGKKANSSRVTDIMSHNLFSATPDMSVEEAAQLMAEHQIRRLPVVDQGQVVGMISLGDLSINQYSDQRAGAALTKISEHHPH